MNLLLTCLLSFPLALKMVASIPSSISGLFLTSYFMLKFSSEPLSIPLLISRFPSRAEASVIHFLFRR